MNEKGTSKKAHILAAARKCFVEKGYAGTSLRSIAQVAEVPLGLIYHYFENKQKLWRETKVDILHQSFSENILKSAPNEDLASFLDYIVRKRFEFYEKNPDIIHMIHWQVLESQEKDLQISPEHQGDQMAAWIDAIIALQQKNQVIKTFEPKLILSMILRTTSAPFLSSSSPFKTLAEKQKNLELIMHVLLEGLKAQESSQP